eukprot:IDg21890t1
MIDLFTPTASENRHIDSLLMLLGELQSVSLELQKRNTIAEVRALFDETVEEFPTLNSRLVSAANIIQCLKEGSVQSGRYRVRCHWQSGLLKAEGVCLGDQRRYKDTRFIVPTSNAVESLFSRAGNAMSDRRRAVLPSTSRARCFCTANKSLWDVNDVSIIFNTRTRIE